MTTSRANRVSAKSLSPQEVEKLTARCLPKGHQVYRCHSRYLKSRTGNRTDQGSWFFSSASGRFDLPHPRGTLNVAAGTVGAVCESLGVLTLERELPIQELVIRKLVALDLPQQVALVDFTDRRAAQTAKILAAEMTGAAADYRDFQSLAFSIDRAGKGGICSFLRFSGPEREIGYFIFGDGGARKWPAGQELSIAAVVEALGYVVVDDAQMLTSEVDFQD